MIQETLYKSSYTHRVPGLGDPFGQNASLASIGDGRFQEYIVDSTDLNSKAEDKEGESLEFGSSSRPLQF